MLREGLPYNDPLGTLRVVPDASGVLVVAEVHAACSNGARSSHSTPGTFIAMRI